MGVEGLKLPQKISLELLLELVRPYSYLCGISLYANPDLPVNRIKGYSHTEDENDRAYPYENTAGVLERKEGKVCITEKGKEVYELGKS